MNLDSSESGTLRQQLDRKNAELRGSIRRLKEAEERMKEYEEATLEAYDKMDMMEEKLENEQRCLEQAVRVASKLYSKNSQLRTRSIKDKTSKLSARRTAWKQAHSEQIEVFGEVHPQTKFKETDSAIHDSNATNKIQGKEGVVDSSDDEFKEIVSLGVRSKSDLDAALERVNELEIQNEEMAKKIYSLEASVTTKEDIITQLQSIVDGTNAELEELQAKYQMESEVRLSAESYAARMYGKNKAFQRNSMLLRSRRGESFDTKVEDVMKDVERLTGQLEEERIKHKQEVSMLEEKLENALDGGNEKQLRTQLDLLELEVSQLREDKSALEEKNLNLENDLVSNQKTEISSAILSAVPPPPPAPAPPPPPPPITGNSSSSVADLIAQRKAERGSGPVGTNKTRKSSTAVDNFASAMDEMMKRIKSGAPMVRSTSKFDKNSNGTSSPSTDSDNNSADEEYKQFCSRVGSSRRKRMGVEGKSISMPPRMSAGNDKKTLNVWKTGLKPSKPKLHSSGGNGDNGDNGSGVSSEQRKLKFTRGGRFEGSVRHPEGINPDLRKILERQRQKMKSAQE